MNRRLLLQTIGTVVATGGASHLAHAANESIPSDLNKVEAPAAGKVAPLALPPLPYALDALQPHVSRETMEYHYGKHHKGYFDNLAKLLANTPLAEGATLEGLVKTAAPESPIFNNAAQAWNHTFFWHSMKPQGGGQPTGALKAAIDRKYGSYGAFADAFKKAAVGNFGSGWTWLVKRPDGSVDIVNTSNAGTPLTTGDKALLTIDVWEHAYYIDYRNARPKFVDVFLASLANWTFAEGNFKA
ncbi:Superoxide dismutase [Fe] [Aquabacterium sp. CECT 9606]|nr:Superoxide dismutase [Fe] [Aquabacterium sp. CECT 9606]